MTLKEYVNSYGWELEECTPEELREAEKELKLLEAGYDILDGVLAFKL